MRNDERTNVQTRPALLFSCIRCIKNTLSFTTIYRCADRSVVSHGTASPVEDGESVWAGRNANLWPSSPHRDSA